MKAARLHEYGGEDTVKVEDAPKPSAGRDEVLVAVHAAGVNPFDVKVREGMARQMAELDFPATLGGDLAGVVAEIGEDVEGFNVGQAVYGQASALSGQGSFAEFAPVKAAQLAPKPESVDFVTAAALPLVTVSAYQALVDHMKLQEGQKILIHGGAGGIGSIAIQLAKHLGAYVATTVASDQAAFAKELGADETIDYKTQDFSELLKDYDAVFDTVGGETNLKSYKVLKPGGVLVSMVEQPDETLAREGQVQYTHQFTRVTPDRLKAVAELVDQGAIKPVIDQTFPLDQAARALEYQKTGNPKGKVVLQVTAE
jgi:NADPH:quinone reductase-like Zn-dependent oxidoreductase